MGDECVMCGRPIATGAVACFDCIDYSFDAVGIPRQGADMDTGMNATGAERQRAQYEAELLNTVNILRARLEVAEAVRDELQVKYDKLERSDSTKLVLGILAFIFVMSWLCLGTVMDWAMHN